MKNHAILTLMLAALAMGAAPARAGELDPATLHAPFDGLLQATVKDGVVDYKALKEREKLVDAYLERLAAFEISSRPRAERLAFWINAYNAFTLKLILTHYPGIESINDLKEPWDQKVWKAAGKLHSLNEIENEILRKEFQEPRIHFAIVCASFSCPDLASRAYTADKLDEQLEAAATRILGNPKKGFRIARKDDTRVDVEVSKIFEWFRKDFVDHSGSIFKFIVKYIPAEDAAFLKSRRLDVRIDFMEYDWSLNGK